MPCDAIMGATENTPEFVPRLGDILGEKYRIEGFLGEGGMGVVLLARHVLLRQSVAVKLLLPAALQIPDAGARFLREAQAAVAIQNEHVARVLDVGMLPNGLPYMVMEHLTGEDLERVSKRRSYLSVEETADYIVQACMAIAEAHSLGIVHRDIKPSNLFLAVRTDGSSIVKVLDFGLSKRTDGESGDLTATTVVAGSPKYMSPEQVRSLKRVDARTDVWALGVVLYKLLTGVHPFNGPSSTAICAAIAADPVAPMRGFRMELPPALDALVLQCLEKNPDHRPQTVAALAERLAPFAPPAVGALVDRISGRASRQSYPTADAAASSPGPFSPPNLPLVSSLSVGSTSSSAGSSSFERPPASLPGAPATTMQLGAWGQAARPHASRSPAHVLVIAAASVVCIVVVSVIWYSIRSSQNEATNSPRSASSAGATLADPGGARPTDPSAPIPTPPPPPISVTPVPTSAPTATPSSVTLPAPRTTAAPPRPRPKPRNPLDRSD